MPLSIGVPKETAPGESRVALTPETAGKLVKLGIGVRVEHDAGAASCFPDAAYEKNGAAVLSDLSLILKESDILVKVQKPSSGEIDRMKSEAVLIAFLQPAANPELIKHLMAKKITAFSMDAVPRITRAQKLDALSSMSTIAGYKAILMAAGASPKFFPMLTTAAGTVPPARVFVIGAGVAGLQAIATARRLGAVVEAFDTRPAVKEQVESLGAKFAEINLQTDPSQLEDSSGYAKEVSQEIHAKEQELIGGKARQADAVITTALVPGKPAPRLITESMVRDMKPGSVIVDLAAETGGNCALTEPGKEIIKYGVKIFGTLNLPALLPFHASQMYSRNIYALLELLVKDGKLSPDWSDEVLSAMCVSRGGGTQR